jgi:hypothetical protein
MTMRSLTCLLHARLGAAGSVTSTGRALSTPPESVLGAEVGHSNTARTI